MYLGQDHPSCEFCPMREWARPVLDRTPDRAELAIIGEAPGPDDVKEGLVFSGRTGKFIEAWTKASGHDWKHVYVTNLVRCSFGTKIKEDDYRRAAACCQHLLADNLREMGIQVVLCLGNEPWRAITGLKSATTFRGSYLSGADFDLPVRYLTCTIHPAAVLAKEELTPWLELMRADLVHAAEIASGHQDLFVPNVLDASQRQGEDVLRLLISAKEVNEPVAVDVETTGINPRTCGLVTIGIATSQGTISVPWGKLFKTTFGENADAVLAMLLDLFTDPRRDVIFHNKSYDVPVLERIFDTEIKATRHDTLLMHHVLFPKAPHDLQNVTTQYLPTEPWKQLYLASDIAWDAFTEDDGDDDEIQSIIKPLLAPSNMELSQLFWYNAADAAATHALFLKMQQELIVEGLGKVYDGDRRLVDMSLDWSRTGVFVSQDVRDRLNETYRTEIAEHHASLVKQSKMAGFNPASPPQLLRALIGMGCVPSATTKTGQISTARAALLEFRGHPFVDEMFEYREKTKLHSTYIVGLPERVCEDGRLHPAWNLTATPSGRFGTTPAVQNWPRLMREMLVAPDGWVIIAADYAALELRLIALLSGEERLITAFNADEDVHTFLASHRYFEHVWKDASPERRKELRKRGKNVTFGDNYLAGADKLWEQIREKDPSVTLTEVTKMQAILRSTYPNKLKLAAWCLEYAVKHRNLPTPFLGRLRKWPFRPPEATVTINHYIQGGAADQANMAMLRWGDSLKARGVYNSVVYPNLQGHDAFYAYVEEEKAEFELTELVRAMATEVECVSPVTKQLHKIRLTAEGKIGRNYAEV